MCGECCADFDEPISIELNAVAKEHSKVTFGIDSGAALTCIKESVGTDYPTTSAVQRRTLRAANGSCLDDLGDKRLVARLPAGGLKCI